jgi:cytidylate kinase
MPSIIVSSDSPATSWRIAKSVAQNLKYDHLGREFLEEVARVHSAREKDLTRALEARGARLGILNRTRETNLAYIEAAVLERFVDTNVVCEGLGAHLYVRDIPHVMNVRVLEDIRQRIARIAAEEKVSPGRVRRRLEREEERRKRWSREVFGVDESNPSNYDMVISLGQIEIERVVTTICDTIGDRRFEEMTYSRKCIQDRVLEHRVRAELAASHPSVKVAARDGTVMLGVGRGGPNWRKRAEKIKQLVEPLEGVEYIEVYKTLPTKVGGEVIEE